MSLALIRFWFIYVLGFICEKLKEANFHENFKEFLKQEIQHPEIMNNILQLVLLIKKQSKDSIIFLFCFSDLKENILFRQLFNRRTITWI